MAEPSGGSAGALAARPSDTARQDKSRTSLATWLGKPNRNIVLMIVGSIRLPKRRPSFTGQCALMYVASVPLSEFSKLRAQVLKIDSKN